MTKKLTQLINNTQIIFIRGRGEINNEFAEESKMLMNHIYNSNKLLGTKLSGTKEFFSINSSLTADNIFFDELHCGNEAEKQQIFNYLQIVRHLNKRFFITTGKNSEIRQQCLSHGIESLNIGIKSSTDWKRIN